MIAPSSTPFKILGDENDSSVIKKSLKGAKTAEFAKRGGLSSFPDSTKATGLFSVTKSTRKPLLDLSKGQLNSRLTDASAQQPNTENGAIGKRNSNTKMSFSIPIISSNETRSVPILSKKSLPKNNLEDMICSSSGVQEDPYDSVMRRAANIKVRIVPDSGCGSIRKVDNVAEIKKFGESCVFDTKEYQMENFDFFEEDSFPEFPDLEF